MKKIETIQNARTWQYWNVNIVTIVCQVIEIESIKSLNSSEILQYETYRISRIDFTRCVSRHRESKYQNLCHSWINTNQDWTKFIEFLIRKWQDSNHHNSRKWFVHLCNYYMLLCQQFSTNLDICTIWTNLSKKSNETQIDSNIWWDVFIDFEKFDEKWFRHRWNTKSFNAYATNFE